MRTFVGTCRLAHIQDFQAIADISERVYQELLARGSPTFFNWTRQKMLTELEQADSICLLEQNAQVLAFIVLRQLPDAWEISALAVDPRFVGQGCMSGLLMDVIQRFTRGDNGKDLWLEVHAENLPARKLYQKLGLVEVGIRLRYYSDGGSAVLYSYQR